MYICEFSFVYLYKKRVLNIFKENILYIKKIITICHFFPISKIKKNDLFFSSIVVVKYMKNNKKHMKLLSKK